MKIQSQSTLWTDDSINYYQSLYGGRSKPKPARVSIIFSRNFDLIRDLFIRNDVTLYSEKEDFPYLGYAKGNKVWICAPQLKDRREYETLDKVYVDTNTILPPEFTRYMGFMCSRANEVIFI